jgi:3-oxoadipate enol-lactonase
MTESGHSSIAGTFGWTGRNRYANSGALRIAYERRGTLHWWRPWLVLIQGMGFDRSGWGPGLRKLRRHFQLLLVDNRGSGRSDPVAGSFGVAEMADDVVAVLDGAGVGRAHVIGVSLGGMVAQELAVGYPERISSLVLVSTTPGWPFGYPMPAASVRLVAAAAGLARKVPANRYAENAVSAHTAQCHPEVVERLAALLRSRPAAPGTWLGQAIAGAQYAGRLRQRRIRARTLILQGGSDTVVDPRNAELLADRIPGAQLVIFPELGHLLCWEDPGGFAGVVTSFLRTGSGRVPA